MRKFLAKLLAISFLISSVSTSAKALPPDRIEEICRRDPSASVCPINVRVLNKDYSLKSSGQVLPMTFNGTLLVPVRAVSELLDASVSWNQGRGEVTVTKHIAADNSLVEMKLYPLSDSGEVVVSVMNMNDPVPTAKTTRYKIEDAPARVIDGVTYLPLRFIAEVFNMGVSWVSIGRTATIHQGLSSEPTEYHYNQGYEYLTSLLTMNSDGEFVLPEPPGGFRAYPATLKAYRRIILGINEHLDDAVSKNSKLKVTAETRNGRIRVKEGNKHVEDLYGSHTITWLNAISAERYRAEVQRHQIAGTTAVSLVATILTLFTPATYAVKIVGVAVGISGGWFTQRQMRVDGIASCITEGQIHSEEHGKEFTIGIVHSGWKMFCINHYEDRPLPLDSPLFMEVTERVG